jgi:hypothetical protein
MSVYTVVALPNDVRDALDRLAPDSSQRDAIVAAALRLYLTWPRPGEDVSDLAIIEAHADELNAEAEDALHYASYVRG